LLWITQVVLIGTTWVIVTTDVRDD